MKRKKGSYITLKRYSLAGDGGSCPQSQQFCVCVCVCLSALHMGVCKGGWELRQEDKFDASLGHIMSSS